MQITKTVPVRGRNLYKPTSTKWTEKYKKAIPQKQNKSKGPERFTWAFEQTFRGHLLSCSAECYKRKKKENSHFCACETNITLTPKSDKDDNQKSKLYTNFTYEYQCKNST